MKKSLVLTVMGAMLLFTLAAQADTGYSITVTTHYQFGCNGAANGVCGGPDTGFFTITNNGASSYTGTIGDVAVSNFSGDYSFTSGVLTLGSGASITYGVNGESSNQGGYNGPFGSPQNGVQIVLNGSFTLGADTTGPLSLSVYDKDIHSGVFQTNPFGISLDNYVLQGGDPLGRDTGDAFEVAQADGHYTFEHRVAGQVPEPASLALLGSGLIGLAGRIRKRLM